MTTQFEINCAIMSGCSYISTRPEINRFPVPSGWAKITIPDSHYQDPDSGFEAISFRKTSNPNEIVISFAGTGPEVPNPDLIADFNLATGVVCAQQLKDAAAYYLEIRKNNLGAHITFTGHSLGGGLAALMGVLFNEQAVTFDQAPFANSLSMSNRAELLAYLGTLFTQEEIAMYADGLISCGEAEFTSRQSNVSGYYVQGEILSSSALFAPFSTIGSQTPITHGATADNLALTVSLHSQALLAAFMLGDQVPGGETLRGTSEKLPDLVKMFSDNNRLYRHAIALKKFTKADSIPSCPQKQAATGYRNCCPFSQGTSLCMSSLR